MLIELPGLEQAKRKGQPIHCKHLADAAALKVNTDDDAYWRTAERFLRDTHGKTPSELSTKQLNWLGSLRQNLTHPAGDTDDTPFNEVQAAKISRDSKSNSNLEKSKQ
jgi:hypothetical protein